MGPLAVDRDDGGNLLLHGRLPAMSGIRLSSRRGVLPSWHPIAGRRHVMANWRTLCKLALLADGTIDDREVEIIRKEFFADGRIDRTELEFLMEVKHEADSYVPAFQKLLFEAARSVILADGSIDAREVIWLRNWIYADGKVDEDEKHWLPEF